MSTWTVVSLVAGIPLGYLTLVGVVYASLPEHWASPSKYAPDNGPRMVASIFWPMTGPIFVGTLLVTRVRSRRAVKLPRATARSVR